MKGQLFEKCKSINILDIISLYKLGTPERKGKRYFLKSPIKMEKTSSFCVYPETNSFYDFSSAIGGDGAKLVSIVFNLKPLDAVQKICSDFGISEKLETNESIKIAIKKRKKTQQEQEELKIKLKSTFNSWADKYQYYDDLIRKYGNLFNTDDDPLKILLLNRAKFEALCNEFINANEEGKIRIVEGFNYANR